MFKFEKMKNLLALFFILGSLTYMSAQTSRNQPGSSSDTEESPILNMLESVSVIDEDSLVNPYWIITPYSQVDSLNAPYIFYGYPKYEALPTFYHTFYFNAGDSINVVPVRTSGSYSVCLINMDTKSVYKTVSVNQLPIPSTEPSQIHMTAPLSGNYVLCAFSTCKRQLSSTINVNGVSFTNVTIAPNFLLFRGTPMEYNVFTKKTTDPVLLILFNTGNGSFVEDGIMDLTHYAWGTYDVRLNTVTDNSSLKALAVIPKNPSGGSVMMDLYARCMVEAYLNSTVFPQMYKYDTVFSDGGYYDYNSFAWACGRWLEWIDYVYSPGVGELAFYDALFAEAGFTRTGATEENSVLDLYGRPMTRPTYLNVSVKHDAKPHVLSYDWDLKMGVYGRLMHPRHAIDSVNPMSHFNLGKVMYKYRKDTSLDRFSIPIVYENIIFNEDELGEIRSGLSTLSTSDSLGLEKKYEEVKEIFKTSGSSTLLSLEEVKEYKELLDLCMSNESMMDFFYNKLDKGELIPCLLVYDVMQSTDPTILDRSKAEMAKYSRRNDVRIKRTIQSEAVSCAKGLLKLRKHDGKKNYVTDNPAFSNDADAFSMVVEDRDIHVNFTLDRAMRVLLRVDTEYGLPIGQAFGRSMLQSGEYERTLHVPQNGTYIVSLLLNGQIYSRKVYVR